MNLRTSRSITISNILSKILASLAFALALILTMLFGIGINTPIIVGIGLLYLCIPFINKHNSIAGRIILCVTGPLITTVAALLPKLYDHSFTDILYYDTRFFLILFSIVPCLVFDMRERVSMYATLALAFLPLVLFDPIHEFFNVGYFQKGFVGTSYYYINYVAVICYVGTVAGALTLRTIVNESEEHAAHYLEELQANQEQLLAANGVIQEQKLKLEKRVDETVEDLRLANKELRRYNNEILQFSYAISHRLRAPVARLLGLINVVHLGEAYSAEDFKGFMQQIRRSGLEVDSVVHELNNILIISDAALVTKEVVEFDLLWSKVRAVLDLQDLMVGRSFDVDFSRAPNIVSVRSMMFNILLNLVSNALKFRSGERDLKVVVRTSCASNSILLTVSDNGIGLDVDRLQGDIFNMHKTFDQQRKGLGLYLVKAQAEFLNGTVDVTSELNRGTTFVVGLPLN